MEVGNESNGRPVYNSGTTLWQMEETWINKVSTVLLLIRELKAYYKMDGMLRVRHNECFPIFSSWLAECCSDMPYFGGFEKAPPDWMVPEDWRRRVEALTPHGTPGTKPDLIIANTVALGKFKVRIIDFQVAFEDNLEFAKESKKRH